MFKGNHEDSFAVLTEMKINRLNALVSIETNKEGEIDFNIISSVYGKNGKGVIGWINDGNLLYAEKEKTLDFISPSAPIADATQNQELISAAKVIEKFENPQIKDENADAKGRVATYPILRKTTLYVLVPSWELH